MEGGGGFTLWYVDTVTKIIAIYSIFQFLQGLFSSSLQWILKFTLNMHTGKVGQIPIGTTCSQTDQK